MSDHTPSLDNDQDQATCCPEFDPTQWDGKFLDWDNKKFIKGTVFTLFFIPINFGSVMKKLDAVTRKAGAKFQDNMSLSDHTSKWSMDLYAAVDREIPEANNVTLSGKYYSKVYEGDFRNTGQWYDDFVLAVKNQGMTTGKQYMWYTTCPTCAKKYGKNYVVIIGRIE